jgi:DNA replication protein DnaC
MILTSNQSFGAWGEVFGDRVIATAILDRLLHHAVTLNIPGNSWAEGKAQGRPGAITRRRQFPTG